MISRRVLVSAFTFVVLVAGSPVSADDTDASDAPRTTGPLIGLSLDCEDDGFASGPNGSIGKACSWSYDLAPVESNVGEDFSAYWIQLEIDPGPGWCASFLSFEIDVPSSSRIVSAVPEAAFRTAKSTPVTTELLVDGDGTAPLPGTVAQDLTLTKGRTKVSLSDQHYRYAWRGRSPNKVMVAIGLQFAHTTAPSELISLWMESIGFGATSCRTPHGAIPLSLDRWLPPTGPVISGPR